MSNNFAVIVTWNGESCVEKCVRSLLGSNVPLRVVVVDNASTDQTLEIIRRVCPEAIVFSLSHNLGFGRANNIGIKYAYDQGAGHVLLINQDAYVEPNVTGGLADLQRSNPKFGILSPLHLDGTGRNLEQLFSSHISKASSIRQLLSDLLLDGCPVDVYDARFINAAVWLLSRDCIERVGLFNPAFEHYGEDKEYADRVYFQGLRIGLVPGLRAFHERVQNKPGDEITTKRYLMQEKAIIRYRLSRKVPGTALNILSALSRAIFSTPPNKVSHLNNVRIKATLLTSIFSGMPVILRMKRIAYRGGGSFFQETDSDRNRYLSSKGVGLQPNHNFKADPGESIGQVTS